MRGRNKGPAGRYLGGSDKNVAKKIAQNGKSEHPQCPLSQRAEA